MEIWILVLGLALGLALGVLVGVLWARVRGADAATADLLDQAELMQGLDRLSDQVHHLDLARAEWQGQFDTQVEQLRLETRSLSTALRRPQVRGRWGELHLRRAVELAGMTDRVDFTEQVRLDDGALRPDLVVHLAGGKQVVVDAKVPLDAHLDAAAATDDHARAEHLARHARQVRTHVDQLGSKAYWRALEESPEFVVLFVPAESFLAAALEADHSLIEYAAARQVVLATPTTLIALLRTVAQGWTHERLAEEAREIHRLGRDLHHRLVGFSGHLDGIGKALNRAVADYNRAMGSYERRVLVAARRFGDLAVTDETLERPRTVELHAVEALPSADPPRRAATAAGGGDSTVAPTRQGL